MVSSLSMTFKRAVLNENVEEAKKEHRQTLKTLMDQYAEDVQNGKADGIRTAKELVEVMKMDLLLMGEATDRTENSTPDEVRVNKITQMLDGNENLDTVLEDLMMTLNQANDDEDTFIVKSEEVTAPTPESTEPQEDNPE